MSEIIIKHSMLPWKEVDTEDGYCIVVMDDSHSILIGNLEDTCETCHANSRLISLSPELYQALTTIEDYSAGTEHIEPESYKELLDSINIVAQAILKKVDLK